MSRLIVKNLPGQITKEKLLQIFSEKGVVTDVQLKYTKDGIFRKFAFIGFQKPEYAEAAKAALNKSYINLSRIQVEICAELGDPNKPRAWSKYAPENSVKVKRKHEETENDINSKRKLKKKDGEKIKDPKIKELLKTHENDELFSEFMKVNVPDLQLKELKSGNDLEKEKEEVETDNKEVNVEIANVLANQDISDAEYIKLKTGQDLNLKCDPASENNLEKKEKKIRNYELYTIKIKGLPFRVEKKEIKEFLKPLKPFTIRRALHVKGIAYCGFKTEKEMKQAIMKNRSFLNGRRLFVMPVKKEIVYNNSELDKKWQMENDRVKNVETVAESGRIFVRNLPYTATESELQEAFEKYGPISEFIFPIDSFTRKPKGFAIVTFLIPEHACKAFNELDGTIFCGRMLHLLPALTNNEKDEFDTTDGSTFKQKKLKKDQAKANSSVNWNTFFIGENALAEAMAATYNTTKESVLNDKQSGTAVRLALGETQIINKMKEFLEENDVCLESFENMSISSRSKTVILVKNLPFGTNSNELSEKFSKFGPLKRIVLPPSGVAGLVEFIEPSEAKIAFRRLAYSKFKHVPLYLEWAPNKVFKNEKDIQETDNNTIKNEEPQKNNEVKEESDKNIVTKEKLDTEMSSVPGVTNEENKIPKEHIPEEGAILFVKNLNFSTEEKALHKHFEKCGQIISATVARKKDPKQPGKSLSMGYGFVEFSSKESADKALKTLQFTNLDNHKIELKRSNRTVASDTPSLRRANQNQNKPSSKILVRNVPFQATKKEINDLFKVFGEIKAVRLPKKMVGTGSHRGFCFVEYNTVQDAKRAFAALCQSTHLYGRRLVLEWAAMDEDIEALREKTALQFNAGSARNPQNKKVVLDEDQNDE